MSGRFITLEGGDGAGKSTQAARLVERLQARGLEVVRTREPGGSPKAERIREVLLSGRAAGHGPMAEAILFSAARIDHLDTLIRPALARGAWVVCDRFADSTRAYQGATGRVPADRLSALERIVVGATRPDLTLLLDLPPEVGLARVRQRLVAANDPGAPDRFEAEALAVQAARRRIFLEIAAADPARCVVIDATQDAETVADVIWQAVETRLLRETAPAEDESGGEAAHGGG